tara:strand:+ start:1191 stop:2375 length:1185 start_codon:yes stop_codon:yes gene_type:complete
MALLTETNAQYYAGQQDLGVLSNVPGNEITINAWSFDTVAVSAFDEGGIQITSVSNYTLYYDDGSGAGFVAIDEDLSYIFAFNQIKLRDPLSVGYNGRFYIQLKQFAINNNYGGYSYITLNDIINNFIVGYVGAGKLIPGVKRTDVMFHAKRGLQEFSYDTLKSIRAQELTIPASLSVPIPQDYVNYVQMSWVDNLGIKHIIYPTRLTSNPTELPLQDVQGIPTQDAFGENLDADQSITEERWKTANENNITGNYDPFNFNGVYDYTWWKQAYGERYGLNPEITQINGWFTINERLGKMSFSSDLANKLIILEYISDGLAVDGDLKVPKMAEQAMYMHIAHGILSGRSKVPEYVVNRFKRERSSTLRNAKIRLSNIKLEEISQVFRNKSKWIKH